MINRDWIHSNYSHQYNNTQIIYINIIIYIKIMSLYNDNEFIFDLNRPLSSLLCLHANYTPLSDLALIDPHLIINNSFKHKLLDTLAILLCDDILTDSFIIMFRPILIDLVARLVYTTNKNNPNSSSPLPPHHHHICIALSKIVLTVPQIKPMILFYFSKHPNPLATLLALPFSDSIQNQFHSMVPEPELLLRATYRLILTVPDLTQSWNLVHTKSLLECHSLKWTVRVAAAYVYVEFMRLPDALRHKVFDSMMYGSDQVVQELEFFTLDHQAYVTKLNLNLGGGRAECTTPSDKPTNLPSIQITKHHLHPHIVNVCGILLSTDTVSPNPISPPTHQSPPQFIETVTTRKNLCALATAMSLRLPVMIEGDVGSGKSSLIDQLAMYMNQKSNLITLHLGDQCGSDPNQLLGHYISTSTPGKFKWCKGVLTRAVEFGSWLVIEDLHLASHDVQSLLVPILESRTLHIPQRGQTIRAHYNFMMFATVSNTQNKYQFLGAGLWTKIKIAPLTPSELAHVLDSRFPKLKPIVPVLIKAFDFLQGQFLDPLNRSVYKSSNRVLSTRDLIKWCVRCVQFVCPNVTCFHYASSIVDENVIEPLVREAVDVFVNMVPDAKFRAFLVSGLATGLDMPLSKCTFLNETYTPMFEHLEERGLLKVGRVDLSLANMSKQVSKPNIHPFATTAYSKRVLESIAVAIDQKEPVLLVGETGTGKTSIVQYLANSLNVRLHVINFSQQTESSDLLGGYKPVHLGTMIGGLVDDFTAQFGALLSISKNQQFLNSVRSAQLKLKFDAVIHLLERGILSAVNRLNKLEASQEEGNAENHVRASSSSSSASKSTINPKRKRSQSYTAMRHQWTQLSSRVNEFKAMLHTRMKLIFSFVEGTLVSAIQNGDWVLMDEINLATSETLECITGLLESNGSITLSERGDDRPIGRHPRFRLFACMNPATDIGKRDLPTGIRNRFTELYIESPDSYMNDLNLIVVSYLRPVLHLDSQQPNSRETNLVDDVVRLYLESKRLALTTLQDGAQSRPRFSLRTLSRALVFATMSIRIFGNVRRALYEGFSMTFVTLLDTPSQVVLTKVMTEILLAGRPIHSHAVSKYTPPNPDSLVQFGQYWIPRGSYTPNDSIASGVSKYILTKSVERNFANLARAVMTCKYPVLIQGPTSSGKTSMIEHMAYLTNHQFIRINNHEHTDLQEYLGCYVSDSETGNLVFKEGALVTALRCGYWIVLDELNLAPTDVLEALNRLLDDNRELFIPETQQVVRPHPHFMLFATQNPPTNYGGRKILSRAFQNRFLELQFDELPDDELLAILSGRCAIPPTYAKSIISVYQELRRRRQIARMFDGKSSFVTLRDLFRWANRPADSYQQLADNGWMILGERVRSSTERVLVKDVLESVIKRSIKIDPGSLYDRIFHQYKSQIDSVSLDSIVWNVPMKRLFALIVSSLRNCEPVLLVGDTACGKTTVCQVIAKLNQQPLLIVNCHQHSETSDFIGSQRPARSNNGAESHIRESMIIDSSGPESLDNVTDTNHASSNRMFEWQDGPLVQAMKCGHYFLLDEVSLAEDSVLERLNSVLEPSRTLVIAEKGGDVERVVAAPTFQFFATMNPAGDYGKKELSPALRNRFTEIWTDQIEGYTDLFEIVCAKLNGNADMSKKILDYVLWFKEACRNDHVDIVVSMRDLIAWSEFILATQHCLDPNRAFLHGGCMVLLDGIKAIQFAGKCLMKLEHSAGLSANAYVPEIVCSSSQFGVGDFMIAKGQRPVHVHHNEHTFEALTCRKNLMRILRALQIPFKSILLEGSPGVGKTSSVTGLANYSGHELVRINLSEQTDLIDLFGTDLPVEGGYAGEFHWRDGPFLSAMKNGYWVLLDELNLASQSVLEGLNACLDHRGSVYIPELDKTFCKHPKFRIFAAQNPLEEGGGRRGLPKSFLNRFTQVYLQALTNDDMLLIVQATYPEIISLPVLQQMLEFNSQLFHLTMVTREFGMVGSPWEFNLRDVLRWLELMTKTGIADPSVFLDLLYLQRMQTDQDRNKVLNLWNRVTGLSIPCVANPSLLVTRDMVELGFVKMARCVDKPVPKSRSADNLLVPSSMLRPLQAVLSSINAGWMTMLIGPSGAGKTSLIRLSAALTGNQLVEFAINSSVDALELLGGFEQVDKTRSLEHLVHCLCTQTSIVLTQCSASNQKTVPLDVLSQLISYQQGSQLLDSQIEHWIELLSYVSSTCELLISVSDLTIEFHKYQQISDFAGKFEWIDGTLLDAVQNGKWLLLDNANLCSPSVLDRLNPLFEQSSHRYLLINERGQSQDNEFTMVRPHPNFRLFITIDPKFGQISRAMRNRGIEIALTDAQWMTDPHLLSQLIEMTNLTNSAVRSKVLATFSACEPRDFIMALNNVVDLCQRGFSLPQAISFVTDHVGTLSDPNDTSSSPGNNLIIPHPQLLINHSEVSLVQSKLSYLTSPLFPEDHTLYAINHLIENPDLRKWSEKLESWVSWRIQASSQTPIRLDLTTVLTLINRVTTCEPLRNPCAASVWCFVHFVKYKHAQEQLLTQTKVTKLSKMSLFQRAYCVRAFPNRLSASEVSPTLSALYPMINALDDDMALAIYQYEDAVLPVLLWLLSIWVQCLSKNDLVLDLLDAHVTQLLRFAQSSDLFNQSHTKLMALQSTYAGDMEASQAIWHLLHPWTIRSIELLQPVNDLISTDLSCCSPELRDLAIDSLTSVFLSDATEQGTLCSDISRVLALLSPRQKNSETYCETTESVRALLDQQKQLEAKRSLSLQHWVWSSCAAQVLIYISDHSGKALPENYIRLCETFAPSFLELLHFRLTQWSLTNNTEIKRSWNMMYNDLRCVSNLLDSEFSQPKLISSELITSCESSSVIDMSGTITDMKKVAEIFLDHQELLSVDQLSLELDLVLARSRLLHGLPLCSSSSSRISALQHVMTSSWDHLSISEVSFAWINVGLAFLESAIPSSPLDPATRFSLIHKNTSDLEADLKLEIEVRVALELRNNGMDTNETIEWLKTRLCTVQAELRDSNRQLYLRPIDSHDQINRLYVDLRSLLQSLTVPESFLSRLLRGDISSRQLESVQVVQRSLETFVARASKNYPLFSDLLDPIFSGIHDVQHGLALFLKSNSSHSHELAQFSALPAIHPTAFENMVAYACNPLNEMSTTHAVLLLEAIVTHRDLTRNVPNLEASAFSLINVLLQKFLEKREEEKRRLEEQESTFKYATKSIDIIDEELDWFKIEEDQYTLELWKTPGLNDDAPAVRNDMPGDSNVDQKSAKQRERQENERFSSLVYRAFAAYQELFGCWSSSYRLDKITSPNQCAPNASALTHIIALVSNHDRMVVPVDNAKYDFYRHPNLFEVARLKDVLISFDLCLKCLTDQWPEHAVLQQLVTVSHRLAMFPASMPLIKFVESLEFLLEKCDEWERFAASHVSIRSHMSSISALIVDWRRLELFNWANLLDYYDMQEKREGSTWWLHLYSVLLHADGLDVQDLISSIDEFVMSSSIGQLELRLEIIQSLYTQFNVPVLANTRDYYAQFLPHVKSLISRQRIAIEKELKDHIKIASWKDVNVYALKQSAMRTHNQLNKCLRKYRSVLQQSLLTVIGQKSHGLFDDLVTPNVVPHVPRSSQSLHFYPQPIANQLSRVAEWNGSRDAKLNVILTKSFTLSKAIMPIPLPLTEFADDLIQSVSFFKKETDSISKKLAKFEASTMLQIRKKAFSDILKQMRSMGLSWRHATIPTTTDMMQLPSLPYFESVRSSFMPLMRSATSYHLRVVALMQQMPEMMGHRSADIQVNQAERALGYAVDLFRHVGTERRHIIPILAQFSSLSILSSHLDVITSMDNCPTNWTMEHLCSREMLTQSTVAILCQRLVSLDVLSDTVKLKIEDLCATVLRFIRRFQDLYPVSLVQLHDATLLNEWISAKTLARNDLEQLAVRNPRDAVLINGVLEYLAETPAESIVLDSLEITDIVSAGQNIIEATMIQLQHIHAFNTKLACISLPSDNDAATIMPTSVKELHGMVVDFLSKMSSVAVLDILNTTAAWRTVSLNQTLVWHQIKRISPLIKNLTEALHATLHHIMAHHKSVSKAAYVVLLNVTEIVRHGFCVPQDSELDEDENQSAQQGDGKMEDAEGTGIGEGTGKKDVSDEIEDEEQVLGLKNEEREDNDQKDDSRDKNEEGMEMENDFDGEFGDLNLDDKEKDNGLSDSSDEEGSEPDEGMDQVDQPEDHNVDESLWQDDEEQELREADDLESENVNRDNHEVEELNDDRNEVAEQDQKDQGQSELNHEGHMDDQDGVDEHPEETTNEQNKHQPNETESLDGEQDAESDGDLNNLDGMDGQEDSDSSDGYDDMETDEPELSEQGFESDEDIAETGQESNDDPPCATNTDNDDDLAEENKDMDTGIDDAYDQEEALDNSDHEDLMDLDEPTEPNPESLGIDNEQEADNNACTDPAVEETMDQSADDIHTEEKTQVGLSNRDDGKDDAKEETHDTANCNGQVEFENTSSSKQSRGQDESSLNQTEQQQKSLGDAIREWRERLNMVERQQQVTDQLPPPPVDNVANFDADEYEFVQNDDTQANEQTLGAAEKDQQMILPNLPEELEEEDNADLPEDPQHNLQNLKSQNEHMNVSNGHYDENYDHDSKPYDRDNDDLDDAPYHVGLPLATDNDPLTADAEKQLRDEIADDIIHLRSTGQAVPNLWHKYKSVTHHLALQLTEQLRLILEPTLAAKLTGDYKTGKRLNMKKIIPYIASEFKKDKIWLRRTKPSKRTYNVMLAVDDSQSMEDSKSITLAFESMAVLSRAMHQLEVGQLAVSAFGESVRTVHAFDQPFTDDAGAHVLGQFTFAQQRTNVAHLLESAIESFTVASTSQSSGSTWQLLLILSDGVCEDHEHVRHLVRRASEHRILVAFIILDQKLDHESILQLTSVSFDQNQVVMKKYLETFPFDYYIVLRDVTRLPVVLSDTLRQFFSIASQFD